MSRIVSNSAFAVNGDLEQIVSVNGTVLTEDLTAQTSLSNIDSTLSGLLTVEDVSAVNQLTTISGAVSNNRMAVSIDASTATVDVDVDSIGGSALALGSTTSANSIPVVIASDQGSIAVSSTNASNSGSAGNLSNASSVVSGDFSTTVDTSTARTITITGNTTDTASNPIEIHSSVTSGGTKTKILYDIYPDMNGDFYENLPNVAINHLTLKYNATATVTANAIFN